ncbi:MAG: response regulator [Bacteroidia bacterium]
MKKTILLIEDNAEVRENTAEILELSNYKVLTAENGKVGVEAAKKSKPDLIICDIMMPEMDGYGVLFMLGKDPETSGIPFIFLTAKAEKSDIRRGMELGADDYLTKPFDEMALLNAIEIRLKKNEIFKKSFHKNEDGLTEFINDARGLEELQKLSESRKNRTYKKKDIVFHEGDFPYNLYFISKGKVKTFKMNRDGKEYITGIAKEGDFIGYMDILENTDFTETAETLEDSEIQTIVRQDFLSLIYSNRDVAAKFIKMLSGDLKEREERMLNLAYNSVRKRTADALLMLQKRYNGETTGKALPVSREDLAGIVGTSTESVIRTLSDFKEEKLINIEGRNVTLLNVDKLKKIW